MKTIIICLTIYLALCLGIVFNLYKLQCKSVWEKIACVALAPLLIAGPLGGIIYFIINIIIIYLTW